MSTASLVTRGFKYSIAKMVASGYDIKSVIQSIQYGSDTITDIKYYNGTSFVNVILQVNGTVVWQV